nr:DUF3012 domain-containing protein [Pseudomaricurvus alcaniphilus]
MLGLSLVSGGFWGAPEPVGEEWCELMMEKANGDWTDAETRSFSRTCLYE